MTLGGLPNLVGQVPASDAPAWALPQPLWAPGHASAGPASWGHDAYRRPRPNHDKEAAKAKVNDQAKEAVEAKLDLAAQGASPVGAAKGVAVALMQGDHMKASGEALKLSAETLAKGSSVAGTLGAGGDALGAVAAVAKGDAFGAASAASSAVTKLSPALANSTVGAVASAFVIGSGDKQIKSAAKQVKESALVLVDPTGSGGEKVDAAVNLTTGMQQLANVGRAMGNAAVRVFQWGVGKMAKAPATQALSAELSATAKVAAASPLGSFLAKANKWLPWLNFAGVAVAAKTTWDVFHTRQSSIRSKALALGSLAMSGVAVWAGFVLKGWGFLGVIGGSVGVDLALAWSRQKDQSKRGPKGPCPEGARQHGPSRRYAPLPAGTLQSAPNLGLPQA